MVEYKCKYCKFGPVNHKNDYTKHLKTKKHFDNELKFYEEKNMCVGCKKDLKNKSALTRHNCNSKKKYINSKLIKGDHNIMDSYNTTYNIHIGSYSGDLYKFVQQLSSKHTEPLDSTNNQEFFKQQFFARSIAICEAISKDMKLMKSKLTDEIINKVVNRESLSLNDKKVFKLCYDIFKYLDKFICDEYEDDTQETKLQPKITNENQYLNIIYRVHPDKLDAQTNKMFVNEFMNGDENYNANIVKNCINNFISYTLYECFIKSSSTKQSIVQADNEIYHKAMDLDSKTLLILQKSIFIFIYANELFDNIAEYLKIIEPKLQISKKDIKLDAVKDILKKYVTDITVIQ